MENAIPPSYEEATTTNHWDLVATYITGTDLCAACLVSREWHQIFAPWLWGNPAGHFGTENDRVYVALTRFKRTLPFASLNVRQLTHTLRLPPALSEIYNGPKAEWLRDVLEQLPNLQSLIVSQLPFFDHSALLMLRHPGRYYTGPNDDQAETFPLRLLIASRCANATSTGLVEACLHLPSLVFLDFSWTTSARDLTLFSTFRSMRNLQVLKLRGLGLRDNDIDHIADNIGIRVRSLDVTDNRLTDASVNTLLSKCFHSMKDIHSEQSRLRRDRMYGDWPAGMSQPLDPVVNQFRGSDLDEKFLKHLTKADAARMPSEDLPRTGLTHLYISNNFITVGGILSLVKTENLHVLDAGGIDNSKAYHRSRAMSSLSLTPSTAAGSEKLAPVFERHGAKNLTYLRVHHSIITEPTEFEYEQESVAEIDGSSVSALQELAAPHTERAELEHVEHERYELDDTAPMYELAVSQTPRYELSDPMMGNGSELSLRTRRLENEASQVKTNAVFAPEVVDAQEDEAVQLSATGFIGLSSPISPSTPVQNGDSSHMPTCVQSQDIPVKEQITKLEGRRREIRRRTKGLPRGLLPGSLPALQALVLTDIPPFDDETDKITSALKTFIADCALESQLAYSQAALELPTLYVPGRPRFTYQSHRARELFGLSHLILELATSAPTRNPERAWSESSNGSDSPSGPSPIPRYDGFHQHEHSSTGDPDSEAFWRAQQGDFSFFGEEECGLPAREPGRLGPRAIFDEKMMSTEPSAEPLSPVAATSSPTAVTSNPAFAMFGRGKDVVAEMAQWRRLKKLASRDGNVVAGHWRGDIKIVRPSRPRQGTWG